MGLYDGGTQQDTHMASHHHSSRCPQKVSWADKIKKKQHSSSTNHQPQQQKQKYQQQQLTEAQNGVLYCLNQLI